MELPFLQISYDKHSEINNCSAIYKMENKNWYIYNNSYCQERINSKQSVRINQTLLNTKLILDSLQN